MLKRWDKLWENIWKYETYPTSEIHEPVRHCSSCCTWNSYSGSFFEKNWKEDERGGKSAKRSAKDENGKGVSSAHAPRWMWRIRNHKKIRGDNNHLRNLYIQWTLWTIFMDLFSLRSIQRHLVFTCFRGFSRDPSPRKNAKKGNKKHDGVNVYTFREAFKQNFW